VGIGLVAIRTRFVGNWSFEIPGQVAGYAENVSMLAKQWKLRLGMVERGCEAGFLPCRGGVARVAPLFEFAFVRIAMTVGTA
jgi:hypothetical protein